MTPALQRRNSVRMSCLPAPSDKELLRCPEASNRQALGELFQSHRQQAFGIAYSLLNNEDYALEAVQDGFLKVWRALHRLKDPSCFGPYLLRAVRNAALSKGRQRGRYNTISLEAILPDAASLQDHQPPQKAVEERETGHSSSSECSIPGDKESRGLIPGPHKRPTTTCLQSSRAEIS